MCIAQKLNKIASSLPPQVTLVAVSKFHPVESLLEAYSAGQRIFGESRVQEVKQKKPALPNDVQLHFIGHLQTNKVKDIVPFVDLIHGVDSQRLLAEIDKEGRKKSKVVPCLLQVHIAEEESKFGFSANEIRSLTANGAVGQYSNIRICGLMGMATFTNNKEQVRGEFRMLKMLFDELKQTHFASSPSFNVLSMGMSDDYQIAIEEGSTMVRIGSAIFGRRV